MFGVVCAAAAGTAAVALTLRASAREVTLAPPDVTAIERTLRTGDEAQVKAALEAVFGDAALPMLAALAEPSIAATNASAMALDEWLADLDRELRSGRRVAPASVRLALLSAGFGAILEFIRGLSGGTGMTSGLAAGVVGIGAAMLCFELGRKAERRDVELRREWDRLATAIARRLGIETLLESAQSGRREGGRSMRPRRRS